MDLVVTAGRAGRHLAQLDGQSFRCALGPAGPRRDKREGDGATPVGRFALRRVLYRPDRLGAPATALPVQALTPADGWCDDPADPAYNQPVRLPYAARHEKLWRDDAVYDVIVVIGHNDAPPVAGQGSAVFLHVARPGYTPTEGCVALALPDLLAVLAQARPGDALVVEAGVVEAA
jgi:L,D-peptidoglycan transpeptidase YkuD (ErfK/YbiS/YcfS/YnhG family)